MDRSLILVGALALIVFFVVQYTDALYFYRSQTDIRRVTETEKDYDTFYRWVTSDGCTPVKGPQDVLWGLRCPRFHF